LTILERRSTRRTPARRSTREKRSTSRKLANATRKQTRKAAATRR
jgi:hypothetical protein